MMMRMLMKMMLMMVMHMMVMVLMMMVVTEMCAAANAGGGEFVQRHPQQEWEANPQIGREVRGSATGGFLPGRDLERCTISWDIQVRYLVMRKRGVGPVCVRGK